MVLFCKHGWSRWILASFTFIYEQYKLNVKERILLPVAKRQRMIPAHYASLSKKAWDRFMI